MDSALRAQHVAGVLQTFGKVFASVGPTEQVQQIAWKAADLGRCLGQRLTRFDTHRQIETRHAQVGVADGHRKLGLVVLERRYLNPPKRATIFFVDDQVLGNIVKTTSQVTGIRRFEGRIGETFPCAVGGDEILQHVEALFEVG